MKSIIIFIGYFLLLILISTCGHMPADSNSYMFYPLDTGNRWHYTGIITRSEDYPEPIGGENGFDDTVYVKSEILGTILLRDSIETIAMAVNTMGEQDDPAYIHYYQSTEEGLYIVAYENAGGHIIHPKTSKQAQIRFKSYRFAGILEMSQFFERSLSRSNSLADTIIYEDPPVLTLKYPLTIGSQWTYRKDYHPWRIDKRVDGKENIYLPIGTFNCHHIKWLYDLDHDGQWDEDIWIDDYICERGVIRRKFSFIGIFYTDEHGNELGSFDMTQEYTLIEIEF